MNQQFCRRTRREFLWQAGGGFTGLALAGMLDQEFLAAQDVQADGTQWTNPLAAKDPHFAPKAKSVIFLFMYGGPSHIDTFDYKPTMYGMDGKTDRSQNVRTRRTQERGPRRRTALEIQAVRRMRKMGFRSVSPSRTTALTTSPSSTA